MQIFINNPETETIIFAFFFFLALFLTLKKTSQILELNNDLTTQLKGLAILAIIFSHIGYFLTVNQKFLFPLSILAGVGVNLFLFLSGYGLTKSSLKNPLSPLAFFVKRLTKLFIPLWIVISCLLVMDFFILKRSYSLETIIQSYLGFFPKADLAINLDSPLWYFSLILFYYLTFPFFFIKKWPILTSFLILVFSYLLLQLNLPIDKDVIKLYKVHLLAFPLGVFLAGLTFPKKWLGPFEEAKKMPFRAIFLILFTLIFIITSYHSKVGEGIKIEAFVSLVTMFSMISIFLLLPFRFGLFNLFGILSYEIYLFHWPLLYRYDIFYKDLPPFLATLFYLMLFLVLGFLVQILDFRINLVKRIIKRKVL